MLWHEFCHVVTLNLTQSQGTITEGGSAAVYTVALSGEALTAGQSITTTLSITPTGADPAELSVR